MERVTAMESYAVGMEAVKRVLAFVVLIRRVMVLIKKAGS